MPREFSKKRRCLGTPASLFSSRTAAVLGCSPSCHFPLLTSIFLFKYWVHYQFSQHLLSPATGSPLFLILSSGTAKPLLLCCTHLQADCNEWGGRIRPAALTVFLARMGAGPAGARASAYWAPQDWKTGAPCEISPGKCICMFMGRPPSTEFSYKALDCIRSVQKFKPAWYSSLQEWSRKITGDQNLVVQVRKANTPSNMK